MKKRKGEFDDTWFDKLDAIVAGNNDGKADDDELLQVAAKLAVALSPLNQAQSNGQQSPHPPEHTRRSMITNVARRSKSSQRRMFWRSLLAVAAILFLVFGIGSTCATSPRVSAAAIQVSRQVWQTATSFEQVDASSIAILSVKNSGMRPLLPVKLPANTESVEFGIVVDSSNPRAFTAFVADYRIMGQDISVYEQPLDLTTPSLGAQTVQIGSLTGQLFQDNAGNRILQWFQDGMTCQMASTLPANELIMVARQFQPIADWQFIL